MKKYSIIIVFLILVFKTNAQPGPINIQDSLALVDFYNSTNGPNWTHNDNWLIGPVRNWYGIVAGPYPDSSSVGAIWLNNNNLTGYIPAAIGNLTMLQVFNIPHNNLTGVIPQTIGRFKFLSGFDFGHNQLSGTIPDSVCRLSSSLFTSMHLEYNNLAGSVPDSLVKLNELGVFYIQYNHISRLPDLTSLDDGTLLNIRVDNNRLTFEDLEPNMSLYFFNPPYQYYIPQDSVNITIDTTVIEGSIFEMHCTVGGSQNIYQWSKNGIDIPAAVDTVYTLSPVVLADSGYYTCNATSPLVPDLTISRKLINLHTRKGEGINENSQPAMRIYPNPTKDAVYIVNANSGEASITSITGNEIIKQTVNGNNAKIDVSSLEKGLYFIKVISEKGVETGKFLKE